MYAYLQGKFIEKTPAHVYVDVNGVGYEVHISLNTYAHIQNLEQGKLFTHLQVKEDGHVLFGFFENGRRYGRYHWWKENNSSALQMWMSLYHEFNITRQLSYALNTTTIKLK